MRVGNFRIFLVLGENLDFGFADEGHHSVPAGRAIPGRRRDPRSGCGKRQQATGHPVLSVASVKPPAAVTSSVIPPRIGC